MSKAGSKKELQDDLRPEYDLSKLLKDGVRGKYTDRFKAGTNLVLLDPDVAKVFSTDASVNRALRLAIELAHLQKERQAGGTLR